MANRLPDNWTTLNVAKDLGIRGSYPRDLRIKRHVRSPNLIAEFLPPLEDDPRPHQGRTKGGNGKRITISQSMRTPDPMEAGHRAIRWVQEMQRTLRENKEKLEDQQKHSLKNYWEKWFAKETKKRESRRGFEKWKRDESLKWNGAGYGIKHQPWASKSVDRITYADFQDYWEVLDARGNKKNRMSGTKAAQKTLIRKLLKEARADFPNLNIPEFPEITNQSQQVIHLTRPEWDRLLHHIIKLSNGKAQEALSQAEYESLHFSKSSRNNQRNWVDLYDTLSLMWFFFLRAEDLPRLRSEWFHERDNEVFLKLEVTKGDRHKAATNCYREDGLDSWRRIKKRKPRGFLIFPGIKRTDGETPSTFTKTLNELFRQALETCTPPISSMGMTMTNVRHTAFRLMLEEDPTLGVPPSIYSFAENGMTSAKMLYDTYLKYIEAEKTAKTTRAKVERASWSLQSRLP